MSPLHWGTTQTSDQHFVIHLWYSHPSTHFLYHNIGHSHLNITCFVPHLELGQNLHTEHTGKNWVHTVSCEHAGAGTDTPGKKKDKSTRRRVVTQACDCKRWSPLRISRQFWYEHVCERVMNGNCGVIGLL